MQPQRRIGIASLVIAIAIFASSSPALAQDRDVQIEPVKVRDNLYMLVGQGGNIGLSIGESGAFMIDDQFAPLTGQIIEAVGKLTDKPIRFLVNTHFHFDHTGGNENFAGVGAVIVAHENVRARMSKDQFIEAINNTTPAAPPEALPVITFTSELTFHWNGDDIRVFHVAPAHTDGDSIIHFKSANVFHMGDTYFNGMYPFIDTGSGGNIQGMIDAVDLVLKTANDETKIMPGHGPLSGVKELRDYRALLVTARERIGKLKKEGKSRDEVVAAKPMKDHDGTWGKGFMQPDQWVAIVYDGIR